MEQRAIKEDLVSRISESRQHDDQELKTGGEPSLDARSHKAPALPLQGQQEMPWFVRAAFEGKLCYFSRQL
jgi:hypothetical protein